jgi:membrane fusion protein, multidrug efflux system
VKISQVIFCLFIIGICVSFAQPGCSGGDKSKNNKAARQQRPGANVPAPLVIVSPVVQKTVPIYQEYVGRTEAANTVEIRAQVTGVLQSINFTEGSVVQKGQLLFVIDPGTYEAALNEARATLVQREAALGKAKQDVARYTPLAQQNAIPKEQLDTAIAAQQQEAANVEAARAQVKQAELNVGYTRIRAPLSGNIGTAQVKIGGLVQQGTTLLDTIYSVNPMYVNFSVSETQYLDYQKRIRKQQTSPAPMKLILADGSEYQYPGAFNMAAPEVTPTTGTLSLRAEFPNPNALLKPGLFVRLRLTTEQKPNAILVPQQAVQTLQGVQSVFVVRNDNTVVNRTITTGGRVGDYQIVQNGVTAGERVIVEGAQRVQPGMQVKPQEQPPSAVIANLR